MRALGPEAALTDGCAKVCFDPVLSGPRKRLYLKGSLGSSLKEFGVPFGLI